MMFVSIMALMRRFPLFALSLALAIVSGCNPNSGGPTTPEKHSPADQTAAGTKPGEKSDNSVTSTPPSSPTDKRPVVVTFGDSLSAGFGADPGKSYPDYLQKLIDGANKNYRVYNAGVSGDTSTDGLERLPAIVAMKPQIVILEFGGNDGLRGIPVATVKANLQKIITALKGAGAQVVLAGMTLPRNYGPDYLHQFEQVYVQLANENHLTRIPFLLNGVATDAKLMQQDGIHPTAEGNKKVAETVFNAIKPNLTASIK